MYIDFHVKYSLFFSGFHENPSSGSRVVPCGLTGRRIDMTKPVVAFHNFANDPKNY
jgi:hypothetical protein